MPFEVKEISNKIKIGATVDGSQKWFSPEEVSAMILEFMKSVAEDYLRQKVTKAVITVPAYFNDTQRQATKTAAQIAGLEVLRIINEPTAAALAYRLNMDESANRKILIYDFGGGTFDVSVLHIKGSTITVLATDGDTNLGGNDIDQALTEYFIDEFEKKFRKSGVREDAKALAKMKKEIELKKRELSSRPLTDIYVESLFDGIEFTASFTRAKLDELSRNILKRTIDCVERCLSAACLSKNQIDNVILVGGSTRLCRVQELVAEKFGSYKIAKDINADEAVAVGAAVQAALILGKIPQYRIQDVTPLSLGIQTNCNGISNFMSVIIPRNTPIPVSKTKGYTTLEDNQTSMCYPIYQGERAKADENHHIGTFSSYGHRSAPKGEVAVDLKFDFDFDGILTATSKDCETGKESSYEVSANRLTQSEIEEMMKQAERFRQEDLKFKERAEAWNARRNPFRF